MPQLPGIRLWIYSLGGIALWGSFLGCGKREELLPPATHLAGQIIVLMDTTSSESQSLRQALATEVSTPLLCLPQSEPSFELIYVLPSQFNTRLKRSAALLFVVRAKGNNREESHLKRLFRRHISTDSDTTGLGVHFFRDIYAKEQRAVLLVVRDEGEALLGLSEKSPLLRRYFLTLEREHLIKKMLVASNDTLFEGLRARQGFSLRVPKTYALAKEDSHFFWLRYMGATVDKNLFVHEGTYEDSSVFSNITAYRESITSTWLRDSEKPELHLSTQLELPVLSEPVLFHGQYAMRSCGLWKLSDHSIGGPFVSYLLADTSQRRLYYLEAFLYRPGYKKRDLLREMEALLWTFTSSSERSP